MPTSPLPTQFRKQIHACWYGKAIGGTLGGPVEGEPGPLSLTFYDPVPETALPNDDLDLQVVWLHHIRCNQYRQITPEIFAEAWQKHVLFPFDEYAVARRNYELGITGPAQGATDNVFAECMGGAIRSEVWACVAPGDPKRAAAFAWADAVVDHCGEGVWAEVFNAALQSAAFEKSDRDELIDIALAEIPKDTKLYSAIQDTRKWWDESGDWLKVRQQILDRYENGNFTYVVINLCFQLVGWFDGDGDFGRSICTATNCGMDTDCTAATLGALLGIIDPDCLPEKWTRPIGESVVLSPEIVGVEVPRDLNALTDWTIEVSELLANDCPTVQAVTAHTPSGPESLGLHWPAQTQKLEAPLSDTDSLKAIAGINKAPDTLHGSWLRLTASDMGSEGLLLSIPFKATQSKSAKIMAYYRPGAKVWLDGEPILQFDSESVANNCFWAPSVHRAGPTAAVVPEIAEGEHLLTILLTPPSTNDAVDLVWGFANPDNNLWDIEFLPIS